MRILYLLLALLPNLAFGAVFPHDSVTLSPTATGAALVFELQPGWHIYWDYAGDAGFPPVVTSKSGPLGPFSFPAPEILHQPPLTSYVLSGHVVLPFPAPPGPLTIDASWLVCSDICIPERATLTAAGPVIAVPPGIPDSPFVSTIAPDGTLSVALPSSSSVARAHFFPLTAGQIDNSKPQPMAVSAAGLTLRLPLLDRPKPVSGVLELTDPTGMMQAVRISPQPVAEGTGHLPYILLAFLGGLILNAMPCVFPILALKAFALTRTHRRAAVRFEALGYAAGICATMLALGGLLLGLRAAGVAAGWGFQFQSQHFVAGMALLLFVIGLNFAGLFAVALPAFLNRHLHSANSFLTGALAVLVATPCTAPFMGAALAAALVAPPADALEIFLALGLGLAVPGLVFAAFPALAARLPRPGPWMVIFQRVLAVPMFGTAGWLAWVLFHESGQAGLVDFGQAALLLAICFGARRFGRILALAGVVGAVFCVAIIPAAPGTALTLPGAEPYSPARLAALRAAQTPVFVDATAAWCVTCLVNESSTLATPAVEAAFQAHGVTVLVADWTNKNPDITAFLAAHNAPGVPLYLFYPAVGGVVQLPQILSPGIVFHVLQ
jgi:thiol:disulfide interchange protein DsbD